jgi:hypothetical protein
VRQWRADRPDARKWRAGTAASRAGQAGSPPRPFGLAEPVPTRPASREEPLQLSVSANGSIMPQAAPYARPVPAETDESSADDGVPPAPPTPAQVAQGVIDLLGEVDEAFSSDRWAILGTHRQHATWLLYDGAALRHCCRLLYEIEVAAAAGLELSVRMLGRAAARPGAQKRLLPTSAVNPADSIAVNGGESRATLCACQPARS